ncbi:MAG: hypothetical protein AAGM22_22285 [Acidobacteriota bacterium]
MSRKRKVQIFIAVVLLLYFFGAAYGALGRGAGKAKDVAGTVKRHVEASRKKIKKEMKKPLPKRTYSTKRSMEANDVKVLKTTLPPLLAGAMPAPLKKYFSSPPPSSSVACAGLRLVDALIFLQDRQVTLEEVFWKWDGTLEGHFVQRGGTVLETELTKTGGAKLVIQLDHAFDVQGGVGAKPEQQEANLKMLEQAASAARGHKRILYDWLLREDDDRLKKLASSGFPTARWCAREIPHVDDKPSPPPPPPPPTAES